jgi:transposase InsO family protein
MITDLSVIEQRYKAVLEVVEAEAKLTDVAIRYGVDRKTLYRWVIRYQDQGITALANRSYKPHHCPHQMSQQVEDRIVELRNAHPDWGARTIRNKLRKTIDEIPSLSSIHRCLVRHRLIDHKPRRKRPQDYKRWERSRAMELWQADVMSVPDLVEGMHLQLVTGLDDHSRFCVMSKLLPRATAKPICDALLEALNRYGIPEQILTDNARVFTGKLHKMPTNVLFDRICVNNGIKHILTAPYSPTTTGKIERLHKTIRKEFLTGKRLKTIEEAQEALDRWVYQYNHLREHQSLGDLPPIRRFELIQCVTPEVIDGEVAIEKDPEPKTMIVGRTVDRFGRVSILKHRYHVGRYMAGETVSVESKDGQLFIAHNGVLVATHPRRHRAEDDDRMDRRAKAPSLPTHGGEVMRLVDSSGNISFAGTPYRVGNRYKGALVGVRVVADTLQITLDGKLHRTHPARHDRSKEFGALAQPNGKPRRKSAA